MAPSSKGCRTVSSTRWSRVAVTGGGLTIIANAPNPAGSAILRSSFDDEAINAGGLLLAALLPTLVTASAFTLL